MSTKTTFKRIALVAVAALGLGVLSVAPSSAAPNMTVTTTAGSGSLVGGNAVAALETTTAAKISVSGLFSASTDSVSVVLLRKSGPAASSSVNWHVGLVDTSTGLSTSVRRTASGSALTSLANGANKVALFDSSTSFNIGVSEAYILDGGQAYQGVNLNLIPDSATTRVAGTYVFTAIVTSFTTTGGVTSTVVQTADVTYVIANSAAGSAALATAAALISGTVDPSKTTVIMNAGAPTTLSAVDSAVAVVSTAASTNHASIQVKTFTADSDPTPESVTATITGAGVICNSDGSVCGKSLTITGAGGDNTFRVRADGTAGTGSIVIKTTTVTSPAKSVTFFAKAASTITLAVNKPVVGIATVGDVIRATAKDSAGNIWGGAAYIYASTAADALIAGSNATPVACTFNSTDGYHECPVTGTAKGTANFKVIDASTVALATATSAAAAVRVSTGIATTAKILFDKASYAPGEKAQIWVQVLDAEGNPLAGGTAVTNAFTADIASSVAFSTGGTGLTGSASPTMAAATSATSVTNAGYATYVVYMPFASGDVTLTATGSTGLAASGRVALTATASVVNSSVDSATDAANEATDAANAATDAALAAADAADAATAAAQDASDAVAALSATVAKLVASLKAQITSLTNLVIKIQKKVKA